MPRTARSRRPQRRPERPRQRRPSAGNRTPGSLTRREREVLALVVNLVILIAGFQAIPPQPSGREAEGREPQAQARGAAHGVAADDRHSGLPGGPPQAVQEGLRPLREDLHAAVGLSRIRCQLRGHNRRSST